LKLRCQRNVLEVEKRSESVFPPAKAQSRKVTATGRHPSECEGFKKDFSPWSNDNPISFAGLCVASTLQEMLCGTPRFGCGSAALCLYGE